MVEQEEQVEVVVEVVIVQVELQELLTQVEVVVEEDKVHLKMVVQAVQESLS